MSYRYDRSDPYATPAPPEPPDVTAAPRVAGPQPAPQPEQEPPRHRFTPLKVLAFLGLGCLGIGSVATALVVAALGVGLSSFIASCSDNPIGDSRKNASFIASTNATSRDLEVFDALQGAIDELQDRKASQAGENAGHIISAQELRERIAAGQWPKVDDTESLEPRVWVRIAELSQDWLEEQTQEQWTIVDFAYPFPDNGPIPVPPKRDESSCCYTRLLCTQGDDKDLYTTVAYYRWAKQAYFEGSLDQDRTKANDLAALEESLVATGLLEGRSTMMSRDNLLVWATGDDDPLRDPETFIATANQLTAHMGEYQHVILLNQDTPLVVSYWPLSSRYANNLPNETFSFEEGHRRLLRASFVLDLDYAAADELLNGYRQYDEDITLERLRGTLAPTSQHEWTHPWRAPSENCVFDESMADKTAELLGISPQRVIVASYLKTGSDPYDSLEAWVVLPGDTMPQTPIAFCAKADELRDAFFAQIPREPGKIAQLYLHLFVIDENNVKDAAGEPASFEQLRTVAQAHPADLDGYQVELLLTTMPFVSLSHDEPLSAANPTQPRDVGGSIARSRDWRYSEN